MWLLVEWSDQPDVFPSYGIVHKKYVMDKGSLHKGRFIFVREKHVVGKRRARILTIAERKTPLKEQLKVLDRRDVQVRNLLSMCMRSFPVPDPTKSKEVTADQEDDSMSGSSTFCTYSMPIPRIPNIPSSPSESSTPSPPKEEPVAAFNTTTSSTTSTSSESNVEIPCIQQSESRHRNLQVSRNTSASHSRQLPRHQTSPVRSRSMFSNKPLSPVNANPPPKITIDQATQTDPAPTTPLNKPTVAMFTSFVKQIYGHFNVLVGQMGDQKANHNVNKSVSINKSDDSMPNIIDLSDDESCQNYDENVQILKINLQVVDPNAPVMDENPEDLNENAQVADVEMQDFDENAEDNDENAEVRDENIAVLDENVQVVDPNVQVRDENVIVVNPNEQVREENVPVYVEPRVPRRPNAKPKKLEIRRVSAHSTVQGEPSTSTARVPNTAMHCTPVHCSALQALQAYKLYHQGEDMVPIGSNNTMVPRRILNAINWANYSTATRQLLQAVFPRRVLATHSLTGKPSPAFIHHPPKQRLDPRIVHDVVDTICERCGVTRQWVRGIITTKCTDEARLYRNRQQLYHRHDNACQENRPPPVPVPAPPPAVQPPPDDSSSSSD